MLLCFLAVFFDFSCPQPANLTNATFGHNKYWFFFMTSLVFLFFLIFLMAPPASPAGRDPSDKKQENLENQENRKNQDLCCPNVAYVRFAGLGHEHSKKTARKHSKFAILTRKNKICCAEMLRTQGFLYFGN